MNSLRLPKLMMLILAMCCTLVATAQEQTVTGKVTDPDTKAPLPNVTVRVKNTNTATQTNDAGEFSIKVPSADATLIFSLVSYGVIERKVSAGLSNITLSKFDNKLEDVIVVGYGTKKRLNIQGAVANVKASEIEDLPVANLGSALINRVPGVSVSYSSGKPGSTTDINIRNSITFAGSLAGTTQPLYVIDGIIMNPTPWSQSPNPDFFENLDASQIEDITFLKDASAAIYGAAGAKGVVLITTKKGKIGKPKLSYTGYVGISTEAVKTKTMSAYEHAKMLNDGYELNNTAMSSRFLPADLARLQAMPDRSWYDELWESGKVNRHTLNVSGGSERVTFFAGGSYYNEKGNYGGIKVDKYNVRAGIDAKIIDGLTANLSFASDFNHEERATLKGADPETDNLSIRALYLTPKWVPLQIKGRPTWFNGPNPPGNWSILSLFNSGNYTKNNNQGLSTNFSLEYKPNFLKGLTAKIQYGRNARTSFDKQYYPPYFVADFVRNGNNGLLYSDSTRPALTRITNNDQLSEGTTTSNSYQLITTLSYGKKLGNHDFSVLVGMDQGEAEGRNVFLTKVTQLVANVDEFWAFSNDVTAAASITDIIRNPQGTQFRKRSFISRADYSFKNRYFIEFIGRADASSNFAPEHRWGFFPTVGLGWKISDESFFRDNINFVNSLKLRATYGLVGEDRVANKTYVNRFTQTTGVLFGGVFTNGLDPNLFPNPDATWEKARTFNVGFDASLLRGKINITADFYQRYTYDAFNQLDPTVLPATVGIPSNNAVKNFGRALAWGSEFSIGYRTHFGADWGFNADINFGWSNSQILQQFYSPTNFGLYGSNGLSNIIGKDPRTYNGNNYGYIATGILRTQAEVDALLAKNPTYSIGGAKPQVGFMNFEDINLDGKIDDNDVTLMFDKTTPFLSGGLTLGATYKEFKFQTNLNFSFGGKRFYDTEAKKVPTTTQNAPAFWNDHWTPTNPDAKYPRADAPLAREHSTFWAVSGTQSRINNMVLSYSLPSRLVQKYKIPSARIMLTGTNLWSIVNPLDYKDPYTRDFANYPTLRTISLGLNISL